MPRAIPTILGVIHLSLFRVLSYEIEKDPNRRHRALRVPNFHLKLHPAVLNAFVNEVTLPLVLPPSLILLHCLAVNVGFCQVCRICV